MLVRSLYRYIWRVSGRLQVPLTGLSLLVAGLAFVPLELQRLIVNSVTKSPDVRSLLWLGCGYLAAILILGGTKYGMNMLRGYVAERSIRQLRTAAGQSFGTFSAPRDKQEDAKGGSEGTAVAIVAAEVEPVGGFVGEAISLPVVNLGMFIVIFGYMLWIEYQMAIVAMAIFLPQLYFVPKIQAAINRRAKARVETLRDIGDWLVDDDAPRRGGPDTFNVGIAKIFRLRLQIYTRKYLLKFLINLTQGLGALAVLMIGGWLVIRGETEIGTIVAFLGGIERLGAPWRDLVTYFRQASDVAIKYALIRDAA